MDLRENGDTPRLKGGLIYPRNNLLSAGHAGKKVRINVALFLNGHFIRILGIRLHRYVISDLQEPQAVAVRSWNMILDKAIVHLGTEHIFLHIIRLLT